MERKDFNAIFGLKSTFSHHLIHTLFLQLIIQTHQREEEKCLSESILVICMFDMLKKLVVSGNEEYVLFEIKSEMVKRLTHSFEMKQLSQIKDIVCQFTELSDLKQSLDTLIHTKKELAVNWPVVEGAVKVHTPIPETGTIMNQYHKHFLLINIKRFIYFNNYRIRIIFM